MMNDKMKKIILCMFLLLPTSQVVDALPIAIDDCILAGDCVYQGPVFGFAIDGNQVLAHNFIDNRNASFESKILMEYQLGTSSHQNITNITGSLWLEVNQSYSLSDSLHAMTLYFDQTSLTESPQGIWGDYSTFSNEQHLNMTTDGLLSGSGEAYIQCCEDPYLSLTTPEPFSSTAETSPSLFDSYGNWPLTCLADGCDAGALLNLIGLDYYTDLSSSTALLGFNPDETRSLIYYTTAGYEGYTSTTYSMSAVPVPAAIWLFGFGLLSLFGVARKK